MVEMVENAYEMAIPVKNTKKLYRFFQDVVIFYFFYQKKSKQVQNDPEAVAGKNMTSEIFFYKEKRPKQQNRPNFFDPVGASVRNQKRNSRVFF